MLREKTERQLEEVYHSRKQYLNKKDCCEELHEMCRNCENYCGWKNHDYEGCRDLACFKGIIREYTMMIQRETLNGWHGKRKDS